METATVFDIQRYSTHDGPGIRTVVFFKGCPLSCPWCENPESQSPEPEILFDPSRCIGCGSCLEPGCGLAMRRGPSHPHPDRSRRVPPACASVCASTALRVAGAVWRSDRLAEVVLRDRAFFHSSSGGVTVSGGEPLAQGRFVLEFTALLAAAGITTAVETSLAIPPAELEPFIGKGLLWLADVKHADPALWHTILGGDSAQVWTNLRRLFESGEPVTLRLPLIPGFNDDPASRGLILDALASAGAPRGIRLDILPYHRLAAGKYALLDRPNPYAPEARLAPGAVEAWEADARSRGYAVTQGG